MRKIFTVLITMLIIALAGYSFALVNYILISSPANESIQNTDNDTLGFEFLYQGDSTTASCSLIVDGIYNSTNATTLKNYINTFYANSTLADGVHTWYINCTATGQAAYKSIVRTLTIDTTTPTITTSAPTNGETLTSSSVVFNMSADEECTNGAYINYAGTNVSMSDLGSYEYTYTATIADNNTGINPTFWCVDQVGLVDDDTSVTFYVDVAPSGITFVTPSADDDSYTSDNYTYVNVTFIESYPTNCTISWLNSTLTEINMSILGSNCYFNVTTQAEDEVLFNVTVSDAAGNTATSADRTITFDYTDPTLGTYATSNNTGLADMTITANVTVTDTNKDSCYARVYSSKATSTADVAGTFDGSVCTATITSSHVSADGQFIIEWHANDSVGSTVTGTNQTNYTMNTLATGWNMLQATKNTTLYELGGLSTQITHVSWYNNTAKSYINYVVGTSTNNATVLKEGESAYVYTGYTTTIMRRWVDDMGESLYNVTLTKPYNQLSAYNQSGNTLEELCDEPLSNSSVSITYTIKLNATDQSYINHRCGTSYNNWNATVVPRGESYWVIVDGTTNILRGRDYL